MRHRSSILTHEGASSYSQELLQAASVAAAQAGMTLEQWLAAQTRPQQEQPPLREELISGLESLQNLLQSQENAHYSSQQSNSQMQEMNQTISALKDEIYQLSKQVHQPQAAPQFNDKLSNSFAYPNARASHPDLDNVLAEIERRQSEIAKGKRQPTANLAAANLRPLDSQRIDDKHKTQKALSDLRNDITSLSHNLHSKNSNHSVLALQNELRDLSRSIQMGGNGPSQVQNYDNRLDAIVKQLQGLRPLENLAGLEIEIQSLAKKLDNLALREAPLQDVQQLQKMMTDLKQDVLHSQKPDALNSVSNDIRTLSRQIETMWTNTQAAASPNMVNLEMKLEQLSRTLSTPQQPDPNTLQIRKELRELAERFNQAPAQIAPVNNKDEVRALENKIDQLSHLVSAVVKSERPPMAFVEPKEQSQDPAQIEKMAVMERMLSSLIVKMDNIQKSNNDTSQFADFEKALLTLAKKIENNDEKFNQLAGLEKNIFSLIQQSEHHAQRAPQDYQEPPAPPQVQQAPRSIDKLMERIQPTHTYEQAPAPVRDQAPAPVRDQAPIDRPSFSRPIETGGLPHDLPLEVGGGSPRGRNLGSLNIAMPDMPQAKIGGNSARNYIPVTPFEPQSSTKEQAKASTSALVDTFNAHKKKLLIGLASLLLLFGGLKLTEMLMTPASKAKQFSQVETPKQNQQAIVVEKIITDEAKPLPRTIMPAPTDNTAVGSVNMPPKMELPGVAVNNGWAPVVPNVKEQAIQTTNSGLKARAESGNPSAQFEYANRLFDGVGMVKNPAEGFRYLKLAADANIVPAQFKIASFYEKGIGTSRNVAEAKKYYLAAAGKGHSKAMHNLAVLSTDKSDGKADLRISAIWLRRAAEMGVVDSQFNLAIYYAQGMGVEKSTVESYKWFALAAKGGDKDAAAKRDEFAQLLGEENLSAAKMAVETFVVKPEPPEANYVEVPAGGWDNNLPLAQNKRR